MNRQHGRDDYFANVERVRSARPDIALSSDFIVGFPGETEADFAATLDLVKRANFAAAYSFKYSPRPGTPAAAMEQVPEEAKAERLAALQALINAQAQAFNRASVGRTMDVLFEKPGRLAGQIAGRSPYLQPVQMMAPASMIGSVARVRIARAGTHSLFGEIVGHADSLGDTPSLAVAGGA
jgi:tRNA-2-methylthio-N6-dimethylallyladenosine synthase